MRPDSTALPHQAVKFVDGERLGVELAADFVERRQRIVAIERRVFDALGRDRPAHLLQLERELAPLGRLLVGQASADVRAAAPTR